MRKIGILGGTFNPIHNGHIALAMAAKEQYALDEVWIMPSKLPPHKSHFAMLSEETRMKLIELAIKNQPGFTASDFELRREGLTYTADTLELLTTDYPEVRFYFILGGDSLVSFQTWRHPERILALAAVLAAGRAGYETECIEKAICNLKALYPYAEIGSVTLSDYPVSSSEIRRAFYSGTAECVKEHLPESVFSYLQKHQLYSKVTFSELDEEMQHLLPRKRYLHSVSVAHLAAAYYVSLGHAPERALLAGILHDCAKAYRDEQLVADCDKYSLPVTEVERRNGFLLHGKLGAYYARTHYYLTDEEILSAISFHTTGRRGMTDLEKVVFLADYLEPFRTQPATPELNQIRQLAFQDIDKAIYLALKNTLCYLASTGSEIDSTTVDTYKEYKAKYDCENES